MQLAGISVEVLRLISSDRFHTLRSPTRFFPWCCQCQACKMRTRVVHDKSYIRSMQASGTAKPMLPTSGVQFMDPAGRVPPPAPAMAAGAAFSGERGGDSEGGSGSGGEADPNDGTGTPERGENADNRAPAPAEAPLRRARVSVRARSEAPMVRN